MKNTSNKYFEVTVLERHSEIPGIWNLTSPTDTFQTPMDRSLETNFPRTLMTYSDYEYPRTLRYSRLLIKSSSTWKPTQAIFAIALSSIRR
jgi:hypothetical protein